MTSVSQKMLAVSASAIGSRRWSDVRPANIVLWYAWPNSCAIVWVESRDPDQLSSTSDRSSTSGMQNAPPALPGRGSASIQCSASARSTSPTRPSP